MSKITVKELIKELQIHDQNSEICFGPDKHFTYYKVTDRGSVVQIEFDEVPDIEYQLLPAHPINKI